jgi:pyroglutamyl-peptidase
MKKVLVTGFEPFDGQLINPSLEAIKKLNAFMFDAEIYVLSVPTVFVESIRVVEQAINQKKPDIVILVGQAGGRKDISIERIAINIDDANIPDNLGVKPINQPIIQGGNNAYFSTLPIHQMVDYLKMNNLPVSISNTAGTYVCNHLMYGVLDYLSNNKPDTLAGFIHVPFLHEQVLNQSYFSMSLEEITKAITLCIEVALKELK